MVNMKIYNKTKKEGTKENMRREKGITLIALIITVIILLVLSGIVISFVVGERGIINLVIKAEKSYTKAENDEKRNIEDLYSSILIATNDDAEINISVKELKAFIREEVQNAVWGESVTPTGTIIAQMGNEAPAGYINCDGTIYNISEYKQLAEYIKNQFGSYNYFGGDGNTTFAAPDLRGEFLRGTGSNSHMGNGSGTSVGVHQDATEFPNISYTKGNIYTPDVWDKTYGITKADTSIPYSNNRYRTPVGAEETINSQRVTSRPTNTSVLYCIKY